MKKNKTLSRRLFKSFLVCMAVAFMGVSAAYAEAIHKIKVEGNERIEAATVLSYVNVQPGDSFNPDLMDNALKALYGTGLFSDVSLYQEGRDLVVVVKENPIINEIAFEGNDKFEDDKLLEEVQLRPRTVLTRTKVQMDVERLQEIYRLSGRFSADIQPKIIKLEHNRVNLVFEINEGPVTFISRISFIGNKKYDDADLQKVIRSREDRWWRFWTSDDKYDQDRLAFDRELLRRFYLDHGYVDFKVESAVAELSPDRKNFYVTLSLNEGERYKVGKVSVQSNIPDLNAAPFQSAVTLQPGDWYRATDVEKTITKLTTELGNNQYAFVNVAPAVDRNREARTVDVRFDINEGEKAFIENINISGNQRTLDEVVRREMKLVEGDPFNANKLKQSEQNIRDLGFFEKVEIKPTQGSAPDKTNIDINVAEKSTGELSLGAGYSTTDGVLGDFSIRERNFLGKGQVLALSTTLSSKRSEFDFSFTEPYFLNRDLSAGVDLFHITRDLQEESSYDSRRTGGAFRLGYPLAEKLRQSISYGYEKNDIRNVQAGASTYIQQQAGVRTTSSISQTLSYNNTDSRLDPTEGYNLRWASEFAGLGGDAQFLLNKLTGTYYYPVYDKWTLSVLGEAAKIFGWGGEDIRINERFYIGGATLRGFNDSGIGPRDATSKDALGGNNFWRGSTQLDFPSGLPEDLGVRLHGFSDFGALWGVDGSNVGIDDDSSVRASVGMGVSWRSPAGPVTADFAKAVMKEDYDDEQIFRFNFGTRF